MYRIDRIYDTYVVLGAPDATQIWREPTWTAVARIFSHFSACQRGAAVLRCSQVDAKSRRHIAFGKLSWKPASFAKWTHGSHQPLADSIPWRFERVSVWAPSWTVCDQQGSPPDFFLQVTNEAMGQGYCRPRRFDSTIVCAIAESTGSEQLRSFRQAATDLATLVCSPLAAHQRRPWGRPFGSGFTESIQDLAQSGLFRPGQPHDRPLDCSTFVETWQQL